MVEILTYHFLIKGTNIGFNIYIPNKDSDNFNNSIGISLPLNVADTNWYNLNESYWYDEEKDGKITDEKELIIKAIYCYFNDELETTEIATSFFSNNKYLDIDTIYKVINSYKQDSNIYQV